MISGEYCMYLRKSRMDIEAESRGEGETLSRHRQILLDLARRLSLNVTKEYAEVVSGDTIASRPVVQQLLSDVEQNRWSGVLVVEVERLARGDTIDQGIVAQTFKYSGTKIVTPGKTYDPENEFDEEYFEFGLFMSRREYKTITRRLQQGRVSSVKEGKYVANRPPYGYVRVKLEGQKGFTLAPDPERADIIRMIFDLYTAGDIIDGERRRLGVSLIARRLNELKIAPMRSSVWTAPSIRDILINPTYIGKLRWDWRASKKKMENGTLSKSRPRSSNYIITDGLHPAIVDADVFYKTQELMKLNPPRPIGERAKARSQLAGLVVCGKCGRMMQRRPYSNGQQPSLMCAEPTCDNVSSAFHLVERRIINALSEWAADYKLKWNIDKNDIKPSAKDAAAKRALKKNDEELADLRLQLSNLHDLLERGIYDAETFMTRSKSINERIAAAESTKNDIEKSMDASRMQEIGRTEIIPKIEHLLAVYDNLASPAEKNDLLKDVLEKVVYIKELPDGQRTDPDGFQIEIYPKLPHV
jgi:DNA invertase Pin-like site-specific DNA recombinase